MISNQNNLKFSFRNFKTDDKNGILNQNPLIITKSEAFSFSYTDPERVKYAQLLAKRDLEALKGALSAKKVELISEVEMKPVKVGRCDKSILKNVQVEERSKSVKRLPGPHTPSKIADNRRKGAPSISKFQGMPSRSMSPPVKDTDTSWKPREEGLSMERLQFQVNKCTNKLDQLERSLRTQRTVSRSDITTGKSGRDLKVLEEKLRSLVGVISPVSTNSRQPRTYPQSYPLQSYPPQSFPPQSYLPQSHSTQSQFAEPLHTTQLSPSIDGILHKLDSLATEMDTIKSRWTTLAYETVSVGDYAEESPIDYRFTRQASDLWKESQEQVEDTRVYLDLPRQMVVRLEGDRRRFNDVNQFPCLSTTAITPSRAGEWFSEDIVEEILDDVIKEVDDANGELVEEILKEELSD